VFAEQARHARAQGQAASGQLQGVPHRGSRRDPESAQAVGIERHWRKDWTPVLSFFSICKCFYYPSSSTQAETSCPILSVLVRGTGTRSQRSTETYVQLSTRKTVRLFVVLFLLLVVIARLELGPVNMVIQALQIHSIDQSLYTPSIEKEIQEERTPRFEVSQM
jgi:hypothetical protein